MKSSMLVDFKILKRNEDGDFVPMNKEEAQAVSIGGFSFDVGENSIPFDWDAFTGYEENGVFSFATGRGWAFNDFELSEDFDDDYKNMGLKKEDISAEFLASAHHIEEFFVNFQDGEDEVGIGFFDDNAKPDVDYKLELVEISFENMEPGKDGEYHDMNPEVLRAFNKGERGVLSLDEQIKSSADKVSVARDDVIDNIDKGKER